MTIRILHLSDTHLVAARDAGDGVDSVAALERVLHDVRHVPDIDLVVVSGDVADDAGPGYAEVRARVGAFAAACGAPHVYAVGNHDDRPAFTAALGTGHLGPDGVDRGVAADLDGVVAAVSQVGGLRVVTLDSVVTGAVHGEVGRSQLDWLARVLERPASSGTVVVLHHPPLRLAPYVLTTRLGLSDPGGLAEVIRGTDVRAVLCGHFHCQLAGTLAGVPVVVAPGVHSRADLTAPTDLVRMVAGGSATVVDLDDAGGLVLAALHARDERSGEEVYVVDGATWTPAREG